MNVKTIPAVLALLITVLSSSRAPAQLPAPPLPPGAVPLTPPRDTSAVPTGTAIIRGHVYDAANGAPLRKVQVRVTSPELRENRLAVTDNNGAYEIKNLAAGRYQLNASYVEQGANTDPEFLDRIKDRVTEFSINDVETKTLDLRLVTDL